MTDQTNGCTITLKIGARVQLEGISATRIKHLRRFGGAIPAVGAKGERILIEAKSIWDIVSY